MLQSRPYYDANCLGKSRAVIYKQLLLYHRMFFLLLKLDPANRTYFFYHERQGKYDCINIA